MAPSLLSYWTSPLAIVLPNYWIAIKTFFFFLFFFFFLLGLLLCFYVVVFMFFFAFTVVFLCCRLYCRVKNHDICHFYHLVIGLGILLYNHFGFLSTCLDGTCPLF
jgi:hypothetical protein